VFAYPGTLPAGAYLAWLRDWIWLPATGVTGKFLLLLFPTGHLLSARWRPVAWLAVPAIVVPVLTRPFFIARLENLPVANPLFLPRMRGIPELIGNAAFLLLVPISFAAATSLVLRFRRAGGIERQQIKWLAYAAVFLAIALSASFVSFVHEGVAYLVIAAVLCVPLAVGIAILRYRLYDIDVLINRTLVYSALTLTLGLVYVGCIVLSRTLITPLTGGSEVAIVASTLAIAALFNPLRRRIQDLIDRRFYRRKYDAVKVLAAFGATARDETELDRLTSELLRVVDDTMQPEFVGVWLREPGSDKMIT